MSLQRYQVSIVCATPEAVNAHLERCDEGAVCVASEVATLEAEVAALREKLAEAEREIAGRKLEKESLLKSGDTCLAAVQNELCCAIFNLDGAYDMRDAAVSRAEAAEGLLRRSLDAQSPSSWWHYKRDAEALLAKHGEGK